MNTKNQLASQGLAALIILLLCSIAIMLFGCAENPAAPSSNNSNAVTVDLGTVAVDDPKDKDKDSEVSDTVFICADTVSGEIGIEGGTLKAKIDGKNVEFLVSPSALNEVVPITVIISQFRVNDKVTLYTYECGPSGLQFALPLELTQSIAKGDGTVAAFYYFDDSTLDGDGVGWESIGVSLVSGGKGTFLINHFSKYGISYISADPNTEIGNENHCD